MKKSSKNLINIINTDNYVRNLTAYKFFQLIVVAQNNQIERLTRISQKIIEYRGDAEKLSDQRN